jgi:hypothetical protein
MAVVVALQALSSGVLVRRFADAAVKDVTTNLFFAKDFRFRNNKKSVSRNLLIR